MLNLSIFFRNFHGFLICPSTMFEIVHILKEIINKCSLKLYNAYICNSSGHASCIDVLS